MSLINFRLIIKNNAERAFYLLNFIFKKLINLKNSKAF